MKNYKDLKRIMLLKIHYKEANVLVMELEH